MSRPINPEVKKLMDEGASRTTAYRRVREGPPGPMGRPRNDLTAEDAREVVELLCNEKGWTMSEVAKTLKVSRTVLYERLAESKTAGGKP